MTQDNSNTFPDSTPYGTMYSRSNDYYHGFTSIQNFGAIAHTEALARVFLRKGDASDEIEAMTMAVGEVQSIKRTAHGERPNREAHMDLQARQAQLESSSSLSETIRRAFLDGPSCA